MNDEDTNKKDEVKEYLISMIETYVNSEPLGEITGLGFVGFLLRESYEECPKVVLDDDEEYYLTDDYYVSVENPMIRKDKDSERMKGIVCPLCSKPITVLNFSETGTYNILHSEDVTVDSERYYQCSQCEQEIDNEFLEEVNVL